MNDRDEQSTPEEAAANSTEIRVVEKYIFDKWLDEETFQATSLRGVAIHRQCAGSEAGQPKIVSSLVKGAEQLLAG